MYETLSHRLVYENAWIRLWEDDIRLPNGDKGMYAYTERVDAGSMVIAMTKEGQILLLREWRYPIQDWTYCFPFGGRLSREDALTTAKREFEEETGFIADEWIDLGIIKNDPGHNSQVTPVFLARGLSTGNIHKDASEVHETITLSLQDIDTMISNGQIDNGWLLSGVAKLKIYLQKKD